MVILLLTMLLSTIYYDSINEVPLRYADIISANITLRARKISFKVEVDRLYQNHSGPIYLFLNTDGDSLTGWQTTGYISEDEVYLDGADIMVIINPISPRYSGIYQLFTGGASQYLGRASFYVENLSETRVRLSFDVLCYYEGKISVKLFVSEEGNWGDIMPDTGFISIESALLP